MKSGNISSTLKHSFYLSTFTASSELDSFRVPRYPFGYPLPSESLSDQMAKVSFGPLWFAVFVLIRLRHRDGNPILFLGVNNGVRTGLIFFKTIHTQLFKEDYASIVRLLCFLTILMRNDDIRQSRFFK